MPPKVPTQRDGDVHFTFTENMHYPELGVGETKLRRMVDKVVADVR